MRTGPVPGVLQLRCPALAMSRQELFDQPEQIHKLERFDEIPICAAFHRRPHTVAFTLPGQKDERRAGGCRDVPDGSQNRQAVAVGQVHIAEDNVRLESAHPSQRLRTSGGTSDIKAFEVEQFRKVGDHNLVVFNDLCFSCHQRSGQPGYRRPPYLRHYPAGSGVSAGSATSPASGLAAGAASSVAAGAAISWVAAGDGTTAPDTAITLYRVRYVMIPEDVVRIHRTSVAHITGLAGLNQ